MATLDDLLAVGDLPLLDKVTHRLPADVEATLSTAIGRGVPNGTAALSPTGIPLTSQGVPAATIGTTSGTAADAAAVAAAIAAAAGGKLSLTGGAITGALTVQTPTQPGHAATKAYVDTAAAGSDKIAATEKGAPSGVASLDASARLLLAQVPAGYRHTVLWAAGPNAWPTTRPSTRTDIFMECRAPAGTADPTWLGSYPYDEIWTY